MKVRDLFVRIGFDVDDKELKRLDKGIGQLKSSIKGLTIAIAAAGAGMLFFVREAGKLEQTEIAFTTMLGSAEKAKEVLSDLYAFAAKTPFKIPEVEENAKTLLAMGIEVDKIIPTMKALGDVAAGLSRPLWRVALNFGQVKTQGKLTGRELRDFAVLGVPIMETLVEITGKNDEAISAMVSRGEIGFPIIEEAFRRMSSEGGKFNNMMAKQSKTLFGLWSNLIDFLIIYSRRIGKTLLPQSKKMVVFALEYLQANEKLIKLKAVEFFKNVAKAMEWVFRVAKGVVITIKSMADMFGGLEKAIKFAAIAMGILWGAQMLMGIGNIILALNKVVIAYSTLGKAALLAQLKMLAMPILVGIAVGALIILLQDIKGYFEGKDSVTGLILDAFEKKFPNAFKITKDALESLGELIAGIALALKGILTFDAASIKVGLIEMAKQLPVVKAVTSVGIGPEILPVGRAAAGVISNVITLSPNIRIDVPAWTPPEEIAPAITAAAKEVFYEELEHARRQTEPRQK